MEKLNTNHAGDNARAAIIGAGPAGLAAARALKAVGIPFTIFEKHHEVGGIWDINNEGSPMYKSAHFISSKTMSGHYGYPMPDDYPDYPSNRQILDYIKNFARQWGLYTDIQFHTTVNKVTYDGQLWQVYISQKNNVSSVQSFRWLICANGTNWHCHRPSLKDEDNFSGEIIHSVDYHHADTLKGKRVLVVGAGNSGVDIACDAAFNAEAAYISLRRGYHFIPKHIMGLPADVFGTKSAWLPNRIQQIIFGHLLRLLNGDLSRLGLQKPDHAVMSSHPIMNTQLLHYLQHGDIHAHADIDRLSGSHVHFVDGKIIEVDLIILATGYQWRLPYLDKGFYEWKNNRPQAFLKIFNRRYPSLFINGFIETNGGAYKLFDEMAYLIAKTIEAQAKSDVKAKAVQSFIEGPEPNLGGHIHYVNSDRHTGYTNSDAYRAAIKAMCQALGWQQLNKSFYCSAKTTQVSQSAA